MAYYLHHTLTFQNLAVENIVIELYKKDVVPDAVTDIRATEFRTQYLSGEGNKLDGIIPCEAVLSIWLPVTSPLSYADFIITFHDEWMIKAYDDSQVVFVGYLNPSEGESDFQDKPYELTLSATDGLGFLKQEALSTFAANEYIATHRLSEYLINILAKTGLELPIDIRANIYESSMADRLTNPNMDYFQQTKLHYRTFLKDPSTYISCWDALDKIIHQHHTVYQWNGKWVVNRFAEMQDSIGPTNWRTEFRPYDTVPSITGVLETQTNAQVGRNRKLHPIGAGQKISSRFPIKSATHTYNFITWFEIPANNRFDRGAFIPLLSGGDHTAWEIDEWNYGTFNSLAQMALNPTTSHAYRKSTFDGFGIETKREVVLDNLTAGQKFFLAERFPARAGDKINIELDFADSGGGIVGSGGDRAIFYVFLSKDGINKSHTLLANGRWKTGINFVAGRYESGDDEREPHTFTVNADPLPFDGFIYIAFHNNKTGAEYKYSNFSFEYLPFIANGAKQVAGDYWFTGQNTNYKDVISEEVGISDSIIKVLQGALYRDDSVNLTTPSWHRLGYTEERHYKELVNLGVYNHLYRRQWRISGLFGGTKFAPVSDPTLMEPLSFHRHFEFPDAPELVGVMFMMVPPLSIDYKTGEFDGTFVDCVNGNNFDVGVPTPLAIAQSLVDAINSTTIAEWQALPGAPAAGTTWFPPHANVYPDDPTQVRVEMTYDASPYASADPNGMGNSPSITVIFEGISGLDFTSKVMRWQIGSDVVPGNRFIITMYGVQVVYVVGGSRLYHDGNQTGDGHYFNYKFK